MIRGRSRGALAPLSCCGSWSGHTHSCYLVSDRARKPADHAPDASCEHCTRMAFAALAIAFGSIGRCIAAIDSVEYVNGLFPAAKRLPLLHAIAACACADADGAS